VYSAQPAGHVTGVTHANKRYRLMPPTLTTKTRLRRLGPTQNCSISLHYKDLAGNDLGTNTFNGQPFNSFGAWEELTSMGHQGPPYNEGGPFSVRRFQVSRSVLPMRLSMDTRPLTAGYQFGFSSEGQYCPDSSGFGIPLELTDYFLNTSAAMMQLPASDLNSWGATAIARLSPLNPGASLAQALAELLIDGLPSLPLNLLRRHREFNSLGKEYLNVQFGWVPFLNDLRRLYDTWNSVNSRLAQIIRDNGKGIRRRATLYRNSNTVVSTVGGEGSYNIGFPLSYNYTDPTAGTGVSKKTVVESEKIWFSGRFRYYIPDVTDDQWTKDAKSALFGLNPTPALLWELMPYSWLIDWFSNVGDVINNLSSNGIADLLLDYGYVMRSFRRETIYEQVLSPFFIDIGPQPDLDYGKVGSIPPKILRTTVVEESKERVAATPFGFGLQIGDLSARQFAILSALGLSRLNF
jgi:hypothetical protein